MKHSLKAVLIILLAGCVALAVPSSALADLINTANVSYSDPLGQTYAAPSNTVTVAVAAVPPQVLSPPDISGFPDYAELNGTLSVKYDPILNVSFLWSFAPTSQSPVSRFGGAGVFGRAPSASFTAGAKTGVLSTYGLTTGAYQVTVQAVDNTNAANKSAAVSKSITLVGSDFSQLRVYPNPWRSDRHSGHSQVTLDHLPLGSTVKLFTVSGHLVRELTPGAIPTEVHWDLRNDSGDAVASGVYLYLITVANSSDKARGQIVVIK